MAKMIMTTVGAMIAVFVLVGCQLRESAVPVVLPDPTGRLLIVENNQPPNQRIFSYDLESGEITSVFEAPDFTQIHQLSITADLSTIFMSYTAPPTVNTGFLDRSALFSVPVTPNSADPSLLLGGEVPQEFYLQNALTPDGRYLFFVRFGPRFNGGITTYTITITRIDLTTGEILEAIPNGNWPVVHPNSERMAFVYIDPPTQSRALVTADLNGENQNTLVEVGTFFDIDIPEYTPDGEWIYFTVAEPPGSSSLWEQILGISVAEAHSDLPSHWWRVPAAGGQPEQVNQNAIIIRGGSFSADGNYLAYTSDRGVHLLAVNGEETLLLEELNLGDIIWLP